jgi:short-subunit dehydrogenase
VKLSNRNILVTGANRGIGLGIAEMFAREGAHLHLVIRQEDPVLVAALKKLGAISVKVWLADLGSRDQTEKLITNILGEGVTIDILVNNAGLLTGGLIERQSLDEIYQMFQVNLLSLVHLTRGLLPGMIRRGQGKIINNASVSAFMNFPCATTYAASKAAVVAFTNCLDSELKGTGVTTLCLITPGIKTRMFDEIAKKYGENIEVPNNHISTEQYADRVKQAILSDQTFLSPTGSTAFGLWLSKYLPQLFKWEIKRRFHR